MCDFAEWSDKRVGNKKGGQESSAGPWSTKRVGSSVALGSHLPTLFIAPQSCCDVHGLHSMSHQPAPFLSAHEAKPASMEFTDWAIKRVASVVSRAVVNQKGGQCRTRLAPAHPFHCTTELL